MSYFLIFFDLINNLFEKNKCFAFKINLFKKYLQKPKFLIN